MSPYSDAKVLDELYVDADSPDDQEILVCGCFDYFLAKTKISLTFLLLQFSSIFTM